MRRTSHEAIHGLFGFFLDFVEISIIILPIVAPALLLMGVDPIWLFPAVATTLPRWLFG